MPVHIGILKEQEPGETRVAMVPDVAAKLIKRGCAITLETGAGAAAHFSDDHYQQIGATIANDRRALLHAAQIVWSVQAVSSDAIAELPPSTILMATMRAHQHLDRVRQLAARQITTFAMDLIPRTTRAQAMDVLSSQATVTGYKAALLGAHLSNRLFPMLTTAAGTIRPAKVMVLGAGVAGLQAIATARRLGAMVSAYDVRAAAREEVESLGAKFCGLAIDASGGGGYARELTADERAQEKALLAEQIRTSDVVITTAQIPGRTAPRLIDAAIVQAMQPGSVIVDLAADSGGNCEGSVAGRTVTVHGVIIAGPTNLAAECPAQASTMYAKNLYNFFELLHHPERGITLNWDDDILAGSVLTHAGEIRHAATNAVLKTEIPNG